MEQGVNLGKRQRGAIAIVFGLMLACLIGLVGVGLDLGRVYNRQAELQAVANAAALAAARQLNGTAVGVDNATAKAVAAMNGLKYQYNKSPIAWDQQALSFSASPNGGWVDAATARSAPNGLTFARAMTGNLDAAMGHIELFFMRLVSDSLVSMDVAMTAVAGRSTINVLPLAICALSNTEAAPRANPGPPANVELVQYGFRRGVAYDLMQLNPNGIVAENFVIDPFAQPGAAGSVANIEPAIVGPYVCAGQLAMTRVTGGAIAVGRPFPLPLLVDQLNSRFNLYLGTLCTYASAPPDTNIRQFAFGGAGSGTPWMSVAPAAQVAQATTAGGKLRTVADLLPQPAGTTGPMYGPLWAWAKAVPYSAYVAGAAEPAAGYTTFTTGDWSTLYGPGAPSAVSSYPASTPYRALNGVNLQAPPSAHRGVAGRRVLNVALLSCPVPAGAMSTATVLGIGKFLMTVPATATSIRAEFGGLAAEQSVGGAVELYP